jgi:hypothetical protein
VLTFFSSLDPQPDPNTHYDAWARYVTTDSYVLTHLFLSDLGLILTIFGTFALGAYLAGSRAGRMGLLAMAIVVFGSLLFLMVGGVSTFSVPEQGQMHLQGIEGYREMPTILAQTAMMATFVASFLLMLVGNVLLGAAVWRSGTLPRWAGGPLGCRLLPPGAGYVVRVAADRRRQHPANGARGHGAASDQRGVDGLQRPAPAIPRDGRGRPGPTRRAIIKLPQIPGSPVPEFKRTAIRDQ